VNKRNKDGTYNITFDDGDTDRRVQPEDVGVYNPDDFEVLFLTLCASLARACAMSPYPTCNVSISNAYPTHPT